MEGEALAGAKKNARRRKAWIVFQDESGVSQRPPVRRTWAPRGETPVLEHFFNWKKLSISAVLCYHWNAEATKLFFQTREGSYDTKSLIEFLEGLRHELHGQKVLLIWDGLPAHKSLEMKSYLAKQRKWLVVEQLPGYAPDLNPVELLWGNIKGRELANRCVDMFSELEGAVRTGLRRVGKSVKLAFSFLRHTGLFF
jgi:transposase